MRLPSNSDTSIAAVNHDRRISPLSLIANSIVDFNLTFRKAAVKCIVLRWTTVRSEIQNCNFNAAIFVLHNIVLHKHIYWYPNNHGKT